MPIKQQIQILARISTSGTSNEMVAIHLVHGWMSGPGLEPALVVDSARASSVRVRPHLQFCSRSTQWNDRSSALIFAISLVAAGSTEQAELVRRPIDCHRCVAVVKDVESPSITSVYDVYSQG
nr:hypothetical protein CFP56_69657 [Quercus suber]